MFGKINSSFVSEVLRKIIFVNSHTKQLLFISLSSVSVTAREEPLSPVHNFILAIREIYEGNVETMEKRSKDVA